MKRIEQCKMIEKIMPGNNINKMCTNNLNEKNFSLVRRFQACMVGSLAYYGEQQAERTNVQKNLKKT